MEAFGKVGEQKNSAKAKLKKIAVQQKQTKMGSAEAKKKLKLSKSKRKNFPKKFCWGTLIFDALHTIVKIGQVLLFPPVVEISVAIKLAALVVKAVGDFVANDHPDTAVVHCGRLVFVEKGRLQNSGRETDGIET